MSPRPFELELLRSSFVKHVMTVDCGRMKITARTERVEGGLFLCDKSIMMSSLFCVKIGQKSDQEGRSCDHFLYTE